METKRLYRVLIAIILCGMRTAMLAIEHNTSMTFCTAGGCTFSEYISCPGTTCQHRISSNAITCTDNEDCTVDCGSSGQRDGCVSSVINCPSNVQCSILCQQWFSCWSVVVNTAPNTLFEITCLSTNGACREMDIKGSSNTTLNMICAGAYSCYMATINGTNAASLNILSCTEEYACRRLNVWCPSNVRGEKKCIITGITTYHTNRRILIQTQLQYTGTDNSIGPDTVNSESNNYYAVNSWDDIDFQTPSKIYYFGGTMFCTDDYSKSCQISGDGWQCADTSNVCQDPPTQQPTEAPSNMITHRPTDTPSTQPTKGPTVTPTNQPTEAPSDAPSHVPSTSPSPNPTVHPTVYPTSNPTVVPSLNPTLQPTLNPSANQDPTTAPSKAPTVIPTNVPSAPTGTPTKVTLASPTFRPTMLPSAAPHELKLTMLYQ